MELKNYFYFIKKRSASNRKIKYISYAITILCLALFGIAITFPWVFQKAYRDLDNLMPTGLENALVCTFESSDRRDYSKMNDFYMTVNEDDAVNSIGSMGLYTMNPEFVYEGVNYGPKMIEIYREGLSNFYAAEEFKHLNFDFIENVTVTDICLDFFDLKLLKGSFDAVKYMASNEQLVYLGYNYRGIPVGAELKTQNRLGEDVTIRVAGILDKGEAVIDPSSSITGYSLNYSYEMVMDNMILSVSPHSDSFPINLSGAFLIALNEGVDHDATISRIQEYARAANGELYVNTLYNKVHEQLAASDFILELIEAVNPVLFLVTIIIVLTLQLLTTIIRNDELGVWLSNGLGYKDIWRILLLENLLKMVVSAVIAGIGGGLYVKSLSVLPSAQNHELFFDLYLFGPICALVVSVVLAFIMTMISFAFVSGKSLPDIIKSSWITYRANKSSSVFSYLFIVSFIASFVIMYYGLHFYGEYSRIMENQKSYTYEEAYQFMVSYYSEDECKGKLDYDIGVGNVYEIIELPIGEKDSRPRPVNILMVQHEPLLEELTEGSISMPDETMIEPACIIGDMWLDSIKKKSGKNYITIAGKDLLVVGEFKQSTIKGMDTRVYIFGYTLTPEIRNSWYLFARSEVATNYLFKAATNHNSRERIMEALNNYFGEGNVKDAYTYDQTWESLNTKLEGYMPIVRGILIAMIILCLLNMVFLVFVWSKTHVYEYMVKRTFGYKVVRIFPDVLKSLILYEGLAFCITMVVTFLYELIFRKVGIWTANIENGLMIIVGMFSGFAILLSLVPLVWIAKSQPVDILSSRE